jgi:uncharacterized protein (TIGR02217 family)
MAVPYTFDEILLDPDIFTAEAGSGSPLTGWPTYANTIIKNPKTGVHKTNVNRTDKIEVLTVNMALLTAAKREYFLNVWDGGYGSGVGLRVRVPYAYKVTDEVFGQGDGVTTVFQLKVTRGRPGVTARNNPHPIVKPVTNTNVSGGVTLYEPDGGSPRVIATPFVIKIVSTPTSAYTINNTTGKVTFTAPPANGAALKVTMEYDLPMAFVGNTIPFRHDVTSEAQNVTLREILPAELGLVV